MTIRSAGGMLAVTAALLLGMPHQSSGQEGSLRAYATVLPRVETPTVQVVTESVDGVERPVVVVTGEPGWRVAIQAAGEDLFVSGIRGGEQQGHLRVITSAGLSWDEAGVVPIRVILAAN